MLKLQICGVSLLNFEGVMMSFSFTWLLHSSIPGPPCRKVTKTQTLNLRSMLVVIIQPSLQHLSFFCKVLEIHWLLMWWHIHAEGVWFRLFQWIRVIFQGICILCCFSTRATGITTWSVRFRSHSSGDRMSIKWVIWNSRIPDFTNFAHHSINPCLGSYFLLKRLASEPFTTVLGGQTHRDLNPGPLNLWAHALPLCHPRAATPKPCTKFSI